jgi:hypothetical protein
MAGCQDQQAQAEIGKPKPRSNRQPPRHHAEIKIGANPSRFQPPQRGTEGRAEKEKETKIEERAERKAGKEKETKREKKIVEKKKKKLK